MFKQTAISLTEWKHDGQLYFVVVAQSFFLTVSDYHVRYFAVCSCVDVGVWSAFCSRHCLDVVFQGSLACGKFVLIRI